MAGELQGAGSGAWQQEHLRPRPIRPATVVLDGVVSQAYAIHRSSLRHLDLHSAALCHDRPAVVPLLECAVPIVEGAHDPSHHQRTPLQLDSNPSVCAMADPGDTVLGGPTGHDSSSRHRLLPRPPHLAQDPTSSSPPGTLHTALPHLPAAHTSWEAHPFGGVGHGVGVLLLEWLPPGEAGQEGRGCGGTRSHVPDTSCS
jgi:hypothetical protein